MANRIKGITVEIGGDTTGLDKALKGVDSTIKSTQSQFRQREIIETENNLKSIQEESKKVPSALSVSMKEAGDKIKENWR